MAGEEIRKRVEALVEPVIADLGLELVDIDYRKGRELTSASTLTSPEELPSTTARR